MHMALFGRGTTAVVGWMSSRLDAICIAELARSVGCPRTLITWKSSRRWIISFLFWKDKKEKKIVHVHCIYYFVCGTAKKSQSLNFTLQAVSTVMSITFRWSFACCFLKMSFNLMPVLNPKSLPTVCPDLVYPCMERNIPESYKPWACTTSKGVLGGLVKWGRGGEGGYNRDDK